MIQEGPEVMPRSARGRDRFVRSCISSGRRLACRSGIEGPDVGSISSTRGGGEDQLAGLRSTGRMGKSAHVAKSYLLGLDASWVWEMLLCSVVAARDAVSVQGVFESEELEKTDKLMLTMSDLGRLQARVI